MAISPRKFPYALLLSAGFFAALGGASLLASSGLLPSDVAAGDPFEITAFVLAFLNLGLAMYLLGQASHLVPGSPAYVEYHRPKEWHLHVTVGSFLSSAALFLILGGVALLNVAESAQGRCYRYAPNPCNFSLSPAAGLEFWGTALLIAGPIFLAVCGAGYAVIYLRQRREDRAVRAWLDGEGPLQ